MSAQTWRKTERSRIIQVESAEDLTTVRELFEEYARSLEFDLEFQDFVHEVTSLPGEYSPPGGRLLLARVGGEAAGCVALRKIVGDLCEMKRLYVRPGFRGARIGRTLAEAIVAEARAAGYAAMRLDTVPSMETARSLYRSMGFVEIAPYRFNPIPGALYMELKLGPSCGASPFSFHH
jgi:putative acetyltransferase